MARPNQEPDGDATSSTAVFIETNLDTYLAMIVSHHDTVLHLKEKIMCEHPKCFPYYGKIIINALKVKRKGFFYHLSDSMLVKSAFIGAQKCWFLSVDASSVKQADEKPKPNEPEANNQLALIHYPKTTLGDNSSHQVDSSPNKIIDLGYPGSAYATEKQEHKNGGQAVLETKFDHKKGEILEMQVKTVDDKSNNLVSDSQGDTPPKEATKSIPASKKIKRKRSKRAGNSQEENMTTMINAVVPESSVIVKPINTSDFAENIVTEIPEDVNFGSVVTANSEKRRRKGKKKSSKDQEVIYEPPESLNPEEEKCKEDVGTVAMIVDEENMGIVASDIDKSSHAAIVSEPNVRLAVPSSAVGVEMEHEVVNAEVNSADPDPGPESVLKGTKKVKQHHSAKVEELPSPAVTELGNFRKVVVLSGDEGVVWDDHRVEIKGPDKVNVQRELSNNHGTEEMFPEKCEQLIQGGGEGQSKEAIGSANLAATNINMEPEKSAGSKRLKKRAKKPVSAKADESSVECSSNSGGDRLSKNEKELLPLTQFKRSRENGEIKQNSLVKEAEVKERENKINSLKQNITDATPKKTEDSAAKPRKIMNKHNSGLPIKEQEVGAEELVSSNEKNKEMENAYKTEKKRKSGKTSPKNQSALKHLEPKENIGTDLGSLTSTEDSTQAPLSDTEKHNSIGGPLEFVDAGILNNHNGSDTNAQVDVSKSKGDGINLNDYFCPRERELEAPSVEPVINAVKKIKSSDMALEVKKKIYLENESERKPHPKNSTVIEHKEAKRSMLSMKKIKRKTNMGNIHPTVAKSSNKTMGEVVNSSRYEKSLLATPASIFWDYSSESFEDLDSSKKAPSDDSSSSSDSEGDDGEIGASDGRSKMETKTPLSKHISMDAILRRSSRFKKAKLSAAPSQIEDTESQAVDIVSDSQPTQ